MLEKKLKIIWEENNQVFLPHQTLFTLVNEHCRVIDNQMSELEESKDQNTTQENKKKQLTTINQNIFYVFDHLAKENFSHELATILNRFLLKLREIHHELNTNLHAIDIDKYNTKKDLLSYHNNRNKIWYPLITEPYIQENNALNNRKLTYRIKHFFSEIVNFLSPIGFINTSSRAINEFLSSNQLYFQNIILLKKNIGNCLQSLPNSDNYSEQEKETNHNLIQHTLHINNSFFSLLEKEFNTIHTVINQTMPNSIRPFKISYRRFLFDFKNHLNTQKYNYTNLLIHKTNNLLCSHMQNPKTLFEINENVTSLIEKEKLSLIHDYKKYRFSIRSSARNYSKKIQLILKQYSYQQKTYEKTTITILKDLLHNKIEDFLSFPQNIKLLLSKDTKHTVNTLHYYLTNKTYEHNHPETYLKLLKLIPQITQYNTQYPYHHLISNHLKKQPVISWDNNLAYLFYKQNPKEFIQFIINEFIDNKSNPENLNKIQEKLNQLNLSTFICNNIQSKYAQSVHYPFLLSLYNDSSKETLLNRLQDYPLTEQEHYASYVLATSNNSLHKKAEEELCRIIFKNILKCPDNNLKEIHKKIHQFNIQPIFHQKITCIFQSIEEHISNPTGLNDSKIKEWVSLLKFTNLGSQEKSVCDHLQCLKEATSRIHKQLKEKIISQNILDHEHMQQFKYILTIGKGCELLNQSEILKNRKKTLEQIINLHDKILEQYSNEKKTQANLLNENHTQTLTQNEKIIEKKIISNWIYNLINLNQNNQKPPFPAKKLCPFLKNIKTQKNEYLIDCLIKTMSHTHKDIQHSKTALALWLNTATQDINLLPKSSCNLPTTTLLTNSNTPLKTTSITILNQITQLIDSLDNEIKQKKEINYVYTLIHYILLFNELSLNFESLEKDLEANSYILPELLKDISKEDPSFLNFLPSSQPYSQQLSELFKNFFLSKKSNIYNKLPTP